MYRFVLSSADHHRHHSSTHLLTQKKSRQGVVKSHSNKRDFSLRSSLFTNSATFTHSLLPSCLLLLIHLFIPATKGFHCLIHARIIQTRIELTRLTKPDGRAKNGFSHTRSLTLHSLTELTSLRERKGNRDTFLHQFFLNSLFYG